MDCIELAACKNAAGYTVFRFDGKLIRSNRLTYASANQVSLESLKGIHIRHTCDNPGCSNPSHLIAGTHKDNMHDMFSRGRRQAAVGERASKTKLTAEQVLEIRCRSASGDSDRKIAADYPVGHTTIRAIRVRQTWRHI